MNDPNFEQLVREAVDIRYLIVRAGRMATKSLVEDVLMARYPASVDRRLAHDVLNYCEWQQEERKYFRFRQGGLTWIAEIAPPAPSDYPQIQEVLNVR